MSNKKELDDKFIDLLQDYPEGYLLVFVVGMLFGGIITLAIFI